MKLEGASRISNNTGRSGARATRQLSDSVRKSAERLFDDDRDSFEHGETGDDTVLAMKAGAMAKMKAELQAKSVELKAMTDRTIRAQAYSVQFLSGKMTVEEFAQRFESLNLQPHELCAQENCRNIKTLFSKTGFWGAERTSKRILDFAAALGGDILALKSAFESGYKQAEWLFCAPLPDICQRTRTITLTLFESSSK